MLNSCCVPAPSRYVRVMHESLAQCRKVPVLRYVGRYSPDSRLLRGLGTYQRRGKATVLGQTRDRGLLKKDPGNHMRIDAAQK